MAFSSPLRAAMRSIVAATLLVAVPALASAQTITFTHTGSLGSGTLDGVGFTRKAFTISATGNVLNRQSFGSGFWIDHDAASISIADVGTFTFTSATRTFVNNSGIVGFSRGGAGGFDLYNGPSDVQFETWDMTTSIGPVNGFARLLQWGGDPVLTNAGQLSFLNDDGIAATFQAVVGATAVPEPTSLALFAVAGILLVGHQATRRRSASR